MVERPIAWAAAAMEGEVSGPPGAPARRFRGAVIDSRGALAGALFYALPGQRVDGHDFVADALQNGAVAAVVHHEVEIPENGVTIRVADTLKAFHALTRAVRKTVPKTLIGLTGSVGKTTTKELLAAILAHHFGSARVARNPGNFNNLYGFPLALLNVAEDCEWMVAEMGMSFPGELADLSRLARPDLALFLNVRAVHLENFPNLDGIANAKAELLTGLAQGGTVVANANDLRVERIARRALEEGRAGRVVSFAVRHDEDPHAQEVDVRATPPVPLEGRSGCRFALWAGEERVEVELPVHGLYNAENCLAAAAAAWAVGVPLAAVAAAVADFRPPRGRGEVYALPGGGSLIDDSYNSNPDAAMKALDSAHGVPAGRRVAILGDMLELGPEASELHRWVGRHAAALGFTILGVGELAAELTAAAREAGAVAEHVADAAAAAEWARHNVDTGDLVLVKGSRGIGLEAVVEALLGEPREEAS